MAYQLEGRLLEVCNCNILCPCWVGEDPDYGICESVNSWRVDRGTIEGIDVSELTVATLNHIPGNVLNGNWRSVVYVDDKATPEQHEALLKAFTGKLGGPLADLAQLIGTVAAVERAAVTFEVEEGQGRLRIGDGIAADLAPYQGATGGSTTLHDTVFSTIPGAPAYVGKASLFRVAVPQHDFIIDLAGHNAIQGAFRFEA